MSDLVAAEWLKLRTIRLLLGLIPAVAISCAAVAGAVVSADGARALESAEGVRKALSVAGAGAVLVLVVGIMISAGEYRHGTAADTFLTTPRRHRVIAAKLTVGAGVGLATGTVVSLAGLGIASLLYDVEGAAFPFDDVEVWLTLAGTLAYMTLFAILGVALGALVRHQVTAVAGALAWFAVVEHTLVNLVPDIGRWLPAAAGQAIVRTPLDGLLAPLAGTAVLAAYGIGTALAGMRVAAARDAWNDHPRSGDIHDGTALTPRVRGRRASSATGRHQQPELRDRSRHRRRPGRRGRDPAPHRHRRARSQLMGVGGRRLAVSR